MMVNRIRRLLKQKSGFTIFETVVTFALLGILCTMMVYLITVSLGTYASVTGNANAQEVSAILMEKISGEISAAQAGIKTDNTLMIMHKDVSGGVAGGGLPYANNECIAFTNKMGSKLYICSENGRIVIHFRPYTENHLNIKGVDWTFDEKLYQNYKVDKLNFYIMNSNSNKKTNIIRIELNLVNEKSGYKYNTEKYVECYNFDESQVSKISYGIINED